MTEGGKGEVSIRVRFADGREAALEGSPGRNAVTGASNAPPTLFLPAEERAGAMLAAWTPRRKVPPPGSSSGRSPIRPRRWQHGRTPFSKRSSPAARSLQHLCRCAAVVSGRRHDRHRRLARPGQRQPPIPSGGSTRFAGQRGSDEGRACAAFAGEAARCLGGPACKTLHNRRSRASGRARPRLHRLAR